MRLSSKSFLICVCVLALASCEPVHAQQLKNPKKFYPKGFVKGGVKKESVERPSNTRRTPKKRSPRPKVEEIQPASATSKEGDRPVMDKEKALSQIKGLKRPNVQVEENGITVFEEKEMDEEIEQATAPGIPIDWIGAIFDTADRENLGTEVDKLVEFADKYEFSLGRMILVGFTSNPQALTKEIGRLAVRQASMKFRRVPPERYDVKLAPSYIVSTRWGEIVLEGVSSLDRFFNEKGEYVDPKWENNFRNGITEERAPTSDQKKGLHPSQVRARIGQDLPTLPGKNLKDVPMPKMRSLSPENMPELPTSAENESE